MTRAILAMALAAAAAGCVSSTFRNLRPEQREKYFACWNAGMHKTFGCSQGDTVCHNMYADDYAEHPTQADRDRWLLSKGCPHTMVNPDAYATSADATAGGATSASADDASEP